MEKSALIDVKIRGREIELSRFLKFAGAVPTGGAAKLLIQAGRVLVNGVPEQRRSRSLFPGDVVTLPDGRSFRVTGEGDPCA
ncbi:MAG: RNA-binding S4 domain-containing protein [Bacillota bacterium]|nr:RNA-binding S4 domain-containing protein [Bacillota bacterium]